MSGHCRLGSEEATHALSAAFLSTLMLPVLVEAQAELGASPHVTHVMASIQGASLVCRQVSLKTCACVSLT